MAMQDNTTLDSFDISTAFKTIASLSSRALNETADSSTHDLLWAIIELADSTASKVQQAKEISIS